MADPSLWLPDRNLLMRGLAAVFNNNGSARGQVTELHRQPAQYGTSFPCEIVRCRFEDGTKLSLFCKYSLPGEASAHGQRGGVSYEIEVYRRVLQPLRVSVPAFYGSHTDPKSGTKWLILEYLKRSSRVGKICDTRAMSLTARWIGKFHALGEQWLTSARGSFLTKYGIAYYRGWPRRTSRFAAQWHERFPWLNRLARRCEGELVELERLPQTIIHGEYYPHNIMYRAGLVRPTDWETAAIAPGEIDLATVTEGWSKAQIAQFERAYRRARWPAGAPAHFQRALDLARVYMEFRWLGDLPEWTARRGSVTRFHNLRALAKRLGLF